LFQKEGWLLSKEEYKMEHYWQHRQTRRRFLQMTAAFTALGLSAGCKPITRPQTMDQSMINSPWAELFSRAEQRAVATLAELQSPGMSVGVLKDGQLIYAQGFGLSDVASARPMTPQSVQGMASVSKTFTAAAILQLAEAGKLALNDPVVDYLPYFRMADDRHRQVTINHLLSHTGGIPSGVESEGFLEGYDNPEYDEGASERWVRTLETQQLVNAPGEGFFYTDLGYSMLGEVITKVSGEVFEEYMKQRLFTPLGMVHSTFRLDEVDPELYATPYARDPTSGQVAPNVVQTYNRKWAPAACLYSSVEDMSRWVSAHLNGGKLNGQRILQPESIALLWQHQSQTGWGGILDQYARGWWLGEIDGHPAVLTVGGMPGIQTLGGLIIPDQALAVIALGNYHEGWEMKPYATDFAVWLAGELMA
jgi:CubicO group peptidase (beta-lactamase class C family)